MSKKYGNGKVYAILMARAIEVTVEPIAKCEVTLLSNQRAPLGGPLLKVLASSRIIRSLVSSKQA